MLESDSSSVYGKILIIDDEKDICLMLKGILEDEGHHVNQSWNGASGLRQLTKEQFDLVLLDVWLPDLDGVTVLEKIKSVHPETSVIMMSGHSNIETAMRCTRVGAFNFLEKPLSLDKVLIEINHALRLQFLKSENQTLRKRVENKVKLIGSSPSMKSVLSLIDKISDKTSSILITGENGTGKEVVAKLIHNSGHRSHKPFIAINCAAIPEELIESELFGHEKGSFTGAVTQKRGKFELAHLGTLFLDEVGDMSLKTQSKLLRVLQERCIDRVGSESPIPVDVRIISATNKNLEDEIKKHTFREDLFYRLNVIPIYTPALRDRIEDIPLLANHYLEYFCTENGVRPKQISEKAMNILKKYSWPGNIREIKNIMERLSIIVSDDEIYPTHLPSPMYDSALDGSAIQVQGLLGLNDFRSARNDFERIFILRKLEENEWNVSKTAELLGLERSHLHRKLKQFSVNSETDIN